MYLERLSADGISTSKYYIPNGEFNTSTAGSDVNLPNCTMYCYCRGFESIDAPKSFPWVRPDGGFGNAKTWYATTTLPKGSVLKEGSVAVFDGNYGHVAFVERKINSTYALISESNYDANKSRRDWKYWQKREVELVVGKATLSGVGPLIGFIYLPINDIRVSKRDVSKNQVLIKEEFVHVRKTHNGEIYNGLFCPTGLYNVIEFVDKGQYKWAKIDDECYVAVYDIKNKKSVSWAMIYEVDDKQVDEDKLTKLTEENKKLKSTINTIKTELNELLKSI